MSSTQRHKNAILLTPLLLLLGAAVAVTTENAAAQGDGARIDPRPPAPEREYPPWAGYSAVPAPACTAGTKFCHGGTNDGNPCETPVDCGTGFQRCWDECWDDWSGASCVVHNHDTGEARCYVPKNRYLTVDATVNDQPVAYHVTLHTDGVNDGLDEQYAECGVIGGWLTDPVCLEDDFGTPVDPQPPSSDPCNGDGLFGWVSYLTGGPVIPRVWTEHPLQVGGCKIVPAAVYELRVSPDGDQVLDPPLILMTSDDPLSDSQHFGDVGSGPGFEELPWMPPEGTAGFSDIQAMIITFERSNGPPQVWCDLEINHVINFADIDFCVRAFSGDTYPALTDISNPSGRPLIGWEPCDCP